MEIDKSNMRQVIRDFPKQFERGFSAAQHIKIPSRDISSILVAGMGGSALAGDLLRIHVTDIPLYIHRSYGLPRFAGTNTLVVCMSHSGNTEETLDAFEEARERGLPLVALTKGGALAERAKKQKVPLVLLPDDGIQPRNATGYQFSALLALLAGAGIIDVVKKDMRNLAQSLDSEALEGQGKTLAAAIEETTPIIYASHKNSALSYVYKIKFNENAKTMAFANALPEANHNEIVGLTQPKNKFTLLFLRDSTDDPRIQKRMDGMQKLAEKHGMPYRSIDIKGDSVYNRIFSTILLGDWISYHLALLYGTDPTPVAMVEDFKKSL